MERMLQISKRVWVEMEDCAGQEELPSEPCPRWRGNEEPTDFDEFIWVWLGTWAYKLLCGVLWPLSDPYVPVLCHALPYIFDYFHDFFQQSGEYFPNHPITSRVRRYGFDELNNGRLKTSYIRKTQDALCVKNAPTYRNFSPGIFTVYCAQCCLMLGFSLLDRQESVRTAFEIFLCRRFCGTPLTPTDMEQTWRHQKSQGFSFGVS